MAEARATETASPNIPIMRLSAQAGKTLVENGFVESRFLVGYTDNQGQPHCTGMEIPADAFTTQVQRVLAKDLTSREPVAQGTLSTILFQELDQPKTDRGPIENIKSGLQRYQDRLKFAVSGRPVDPYDMATIKQAVSTRLSILQGLFYYQHNAIRTLPSNIAVWVPDANELNELTAHLTELNTAAEPYLPIEDQQTQVLQTPHGITQSKRPSTLHEILTENGTAYFKD